MEYRETRITENDTKPWGMDVKQFTVLMHLSQYAGFLVPFAGIVLPIIMWTSFNEKNKLIDAHGKSILNFMISFFIYTIITGILSFLLIGIPFLLVVVTCGLILPIIGAIKAGNNELYKYPVTITFLN